MLVFSPAAATVTFFRARGITVAAWQSADSKPRGLYIYHDGHAGDSEPESRVRVAGGESTRIPGAIVRPGPSGTTSCYGPLIKPNIMAGG